MVYAVRTENLRKVYGEVVALEGLTLTVEPGTVFGFLGPNGAGKTTTMRLLTGLARPTAGQAWVAGRQVGRGSSAAASIGYLPEEPAFYPWMTPVELLDHIGRLFGLPREARLARARELLDLVGLGSSSKRRIGGFSRGMRQRLGLAQALINKPEVLLLDEPVSALDPAGRKEVLELINQLGSQHTVFMSTHILQDVERVCDTVAILNHGRLVVEAPQAELLERYTQPAFELECLTSEEQAFQAWLEDLRSLEWVGSVTVDGPVGRVLVRDVQLAHRALLAMVVDAGLVLRRYEMVTPSLEDVFLQLVAREEATP
jgi:ABC-2 type transport system ATP-binding protein